MIAIQKFDLKKPNLILVQWGCACISVADVHVERASSEMCKMYVHSCMGGYHGQPASNFVLIHVMILSLWCIVLSINSFDVHNEPWEYMITTFVNPHLSYLVGEQSWFLFYLVIIIFAML